MTMTEDIERVMALKLIAEHSFDHEGEHDHEDERDYAEACGKLIRTHGPAIAALAERLAAAEANDARYRWIVSADHIPDSVNIAIFLSDKDAVDAAIDTARAGEKG